MSESSVRCLLVSDFTTVNLAGYLANEEEAPSLDPVRAPFGEVTQVLRDPAHPAWGDDPELAIVWTQPERILPAFRRLLDFDAPAEAELLSEVDGFADDVLRAAARLRAVFVPTWSLDPSRHGLGISELRPGGASRALAKMNLRLAERLGGSANAFVLDSQRWLARAGRHGYDAKMWYQCKVPFGTVVFREAVKDVKAAVRGLSGQSRKCVVVDLDDTLWGGTVGEVGWRNLRLGGHDAVGEAFSDFQAALKALARRGILLAIASRNEAPVALEAIRSHPEMRLALDDFAAWRIDWNDKAENVASLAAELKLGLQSFLFIDNSAVERDRVRQALPEVWVPDWPESPLLYPAALRALRCFDTPRMSEEDGNRVRAYAAERERTELRRSATSLDDWLRSLEIRVTIEPLSDENLARAAQLLNKTNQLNLRTRRLTERELKTWSEDPSHHVWVYRVRDKLGDSGLTGLASLTVSDGVAQVTDFVLSCRVIGRKVEETMVAWLVEQAAELGAGEVRADHRPTEKNKPCLDFWRRSGFTRGDDDCFTWRTEVSYPVPEAVRRVAPPVAACADP